MTKRKTQKERIEITFVPISKSEAKDPWVIEEIQNLVARIVLGGIRADLEKAEGVTLSGSKAFLANQTTDAPILEI